MAQQLTVDHDNPSSEGDSVEESLTAHDQEMLAKVEGEEPATQDEPEDKFGGDYDKLKQSYEELEKKFHGTSDNDNDTTDTPSELEIGQQEAPSDAPFDMQALQQEYTEHGQLGEDSYKTLEKAGISKEYVDTYIAGARALGEQMGNNVKESVGGSENYTNMVEWAKVNYTPEQTASYDRAVNSGDINTAMLAAKGLQADYQNSTGVEGKTYSGKQAAPEGKGSTFRSNAELTAAMKDSRYEYDMAYRQDVLDKLDRSDIFNTRTI